MIARQFMYASLSTTQLLNGAAAALWLLLSGPAYALAGTDGLTGLSIASLLCLVPGWIVCWLSTRPIASRSPLIVPVLGMLLRMAFVLAGLVLVHALRPHLGLKEFVVWLLVCYFATLAIETLAAAKKLGERPVTADRSSSPLGRMN